MNTLRNLALSSLCAFGVATAPAPSHAQEPTFKGQTLTMLVGFAAGGGTDVAARLMATYFAKYLPGQPSMITRNMPGAFGMTAYNYILTQTKPDGSVVSMGANSQVDPVNYRKAPVKYDPRDFIYVGGLGRGGSALIINAEAEKRLNDATAKPVVMGSIGGWPRGGMQVTVWGIEFIGWNARWVTGYAGSNDLMIALERGEIDMTSTSNNVLLNKLIATGRFRILNQAGTLENGKFVGRPDLKDVPVFVDQIDGKIKDPIAEKAFKYWVSITATDKFLSLAPNTPAPIVTAYRDAFWSIMKDAEFIEQSSKLSEEVTPMSHQDMELLINTLADTPPEVVSYLTALFGKQGLKVSE